MDATLALLIVTLVIAGIAQIGGPSTSQEFGSLGLKRQANDALRVLTLNGTIENALQKMEEDYEKAGDILRENLNKVVPEGIQYKLSVGDELSVYPTESDDWVDIFENLRENTVSDKISSVPPEKNYLSVLAWTPENREQQFVENIEAMRPNWEVEKITEADEERLRDNLEKTDEDGNPYFDAVFIPDADNTFSSETVTDLKDFSEDGRLVFGGSTLYLNQDISSLRDWFGIEDSIEEEDDNTDTGDVYATDMYVWHTDFNFEHPIVRPFVISHRLEYRGDHIYRYGGEVGTTEGSSSGYDKTNAEVLTSWGDQPESSRLVWNGVIANDTTGSGNPEGDATTVYLNMNIVQTTITENTDPYEWLSLAMRSISGGRYRYYYKPVKLFLWRGEEA